MQQAIVSGIALRLIADPHSSFLNGPDSVSKALPGEPGLRRPILAIRLNICGKNPITILHNLAQNHPARRTDV
jgi:hypothetical protein